MTQVVGVRFTRAGKIYYFDPTDAALVVGDQVLVETAKGREIARVVIGPREVESGEFPEPLKPVLRRAGAEDMACCAQLKIKEQEVMDKCRALTRDLNLPMKLLSAQYDLDGNTVTIMFSAESRVDFREMVRDLAWTLKTKVELRQVGPRDETKLRGGFGRCGRPLCCASYLSEFSPVSIKMAKEQDLPLNPTKISGICGRLLCCLAYEAEQYRHMRARLPAPAQQRPVESGAASLVAGGAVPEEPVGSRATSGEDLPASPAPSDGSPPPARHRRRRRSKRR